MFTAPILEPPNNAEDLVVRDTKGPNANYTSFRLSTNTRLSLPSPKKKLNTFAKLKILILT